MSDESRNVRWPTERFYWALLDASVLPAGRGKLPRGIEFLLEPLVPRPLETLHAIYRPLPGGVFLACAIERDVLRSSLPPDALSLAPAALPEFVRGEVEPGDLELLTGEFTPAAVLALRRTWQRRLLAFAAAAVLLFLVGIERRVRAQDSQRAALERAAEEVHAEVLGPDRLRSPLPPALQLEAEFRTLRQTRAATVPAGELTDAASILSELLVLWDDSIHIETEAIHVTPENLHLQGKVSEIEDAQSVATALQEVPGWTALQPSMHAQAEGFRTTLQWKRLEREQR